MIISRTPFRVSFFGGGTDYPVWYLENGGAVLGTTIDKYCYISCRYLPPFFEHKSRVVYSQIENVKSNKDVTHPAVRGCLGHMGIEEGLEIHHDGDLPARTGLGSSSAFTVGLLHCLFGLKRVMPSKMQLAKEAINVEQDVLRENVGSQDQVSAAFGGFNKITFKRDGRIDVQPIIMNTKRLGLFQSHLMLYFTGFSRYASQIAGEQIRNTPRKVSELTALQQMVEAGLEALTGNESLDAFGRLLHEAWNIKKTLTDKISIPKIDEMYEAAKAAGALGGKLLGAGGGGFLLLFVRPQDQLKVREKMKNLLLVPFQFESAGSQIIFYDSDRMQKDRHPAAAALD